MLQIEDSAMKIENEDRLASKKCTPCSGGVPKYTLEEAREQVRKLPGWHLTHDGLRIRRDWIVQDFAEGIVFFRSVADLAEEEEHHPDLHLENYRNVWIELWTHAIGGLSENDFILAAKINRLPVKLKK
jgi:4a-hydroxytetrahydrobiopterin dehydratase